MKSKDVKELHKLEAKELMSKLTDLKKEFGKLRMEHKVGRLKNVRSLGTLRDDMARVQTIMSSLEKKEIKKA